MNITYAIEYLEEELVRIYGQKVGDKPILVSLSDIAQSAEALLSDDAAGTEPVKYGATRAEVALVDLLNGILLISHQRGFRIGRTLSLAMNDLENTDNEVVDETKESSENS